MERGLEYLLAGALALTACVDPVNDDDSYNDDDVVNDDDMVNDDDITANDDDVSNDDDTTPTNNAPYAEIASPETGSEVIQGIEVFFDACTSYDKDGDSLSYHWFFGDSNTLTLQDDCLASHVYTAEPGLKEVVLRVEDEHGAYDEDTIELTLNEDVKENQPPVAIAGGPYEVDLSVSPYLVVDFSEGGTGSYDPDGEIVNYHVNWGNNGTNTNSSGSMVHQYPAIGEYTLTLTVEDNQGSEDTNTTTVTVY